MSEGVNGNKQNKAEIRVDIEAWTYQTVDWAMSGVVLSLDVAGVNRSRLGELLQDRGLSSFLARALYVKLGPGMFRGATIFLRERRCNSCGKGESKRIARQAIWLTAIMAATTSSNATPAPSTSSSQQPNGTSPWANKYRGVRRPDAPSMCNAPTKHLPRPQ